MQLAEYSQQIHQIFAQRQLFVRVAVRYGDISLASSLRTFAGSKSGPVAFAGLSFCSSFVTPSFETLTSFIGRYGSASGEGMS